MKRFKSQYMTMEEIAEELGITKERVRQILVRALEKMRKEFKKRNINKEDMT